MDSSVNKNGHMMHEEYDSNHSVSASPTTTTISTIVLQSHPIQIVVGLLQSKNALHIKIVEISPKLNFLGANIEETVQLQRDHATVHKKLREQNTPIEEFVIKAEKLLATKNATPELLDAMGQSLSIAWEDLLRIFQQRREVLDANANFHEKIGVCLGKMSALEVACRDTMLPNEIESIHEFLNKFKQLRIEVLASVMVSLKEGNELLAKLRETALCGQLDSRPDSIKVEIKKSITQVELWLEELHDRRNGLEQAWQTRKIQLEQCLALAILMRDIVELESTLRKSKQSVGIASYPLDSDLHVGNALADLESIKHDAVIIRDRALKITRSTEKLSNLGCFAGNDASCKAYEFLNECTEFLEHIDNREQFLTKVREFFGKAEKSLSTLRKLEADTTNQSKDEHTHKYTMKRLLNDITLLTEEPLRLGYDLLDQIGRSNADAFGIEKTVVEIENRKIYFEEFYSQNNAEYIKITEMLNEFCGNCEDISAWLRSVNKAFLGTNNSMGSTIAEGKTFLKLHHQLLSDLEVKGSEINNLFVKMSKILNSLEQQERDEVELRVQTLHDTWNELKTIVENRVDLGTNFTKFLQLTEKLTEMFRYVEEVLRSAPDETKLSQLDELWQKIKPAYTQLKDDGKSFVEHIHMAGDKTLETKSASECVDRILADFSTRQFSITESWENWMTVIVEQRETELILEDIMSKNELTLISASKLDAQLYPILTKQTSDLNVLKAFLRDKLCMVLADIEKAQIEITHHIQTTAELKPKDDKTADKVSQVLRNLNAIVNKLALIQNEFRALIELIMDFLESLITTKNSIELYFDQMLIAGTKLNNVEETLTENQKFADKMLQQFNSLANQCERVIVQIQKQEPTEIKEHDIKYISALLDTLRATFDSQNSARVNRLKNEANIQRFKFDLNDIFQNIDQLKSQLNDTQGKFKETAAAAKTTSLGFEYFEQTIQLLDQRIDIFINTSENICNSNGDAKPFIHNAISELKKYWNDFKRQVNDMRHSIEDTKTYFTINDLIDKSNREHKIYLQTIVSQMPFVKHANEASELINNIDQYISNHESNQLERLKQLAILSKTVYSFDKTIEKYSENIELFQTFFSTKSQLNALIEQLVDEAKAKITAAQQREDELRREKEAEVRQQELLKQKALLEQQAVQKQRIEEQQRMELTITESKQKQSLQESPRFARQLCDATVSAGDRYTFECHIQSSPSPTIEWFKDGISVKNYPGYAVNHENGLCTLSIEETFAEDSGYFMCQATNPAGTVQTSARLFIKLTEEANILLPPSFTRTLKNCSVSAGASLFLDCFVEGNPLPTVQWFRNDVCIDHLPKCNFTYNNGEAILRLDDLIVDDQGTYTCTAKNILGSDHCSATLTVTGVQSIAPHTANAEPENIEQRQHRQRPEFRVPLSNVMACKGQPIKLECELIGDPRPDISWKLNGEPISINNGKLQYDHERVTLLIPEVYPNNAGTYTLCAKNLAGLAYTSCNVSLKGRLPNKNVSDIEMAVDLEPIKPSVQLPLRDVNVTEGNSVQLDCVITGHPEPEVIWYHEGQPVKESADVQLLFRGDRCSLVIQEAYLEDIGEYKVIAINSAGEASSKCVLTVTPLNESDPAKRNAVVELKQANGFESVTPRFEKLLCDILGNEGDTIEFECVVTGAPVPTIKWFLNNSEIFEDDRTKFVHDSDDGKVKLVLTNVVNDDKGVYTVKASNASGEAKCFSHLIVKSVNVAENLLLPNKIKSDVDEKHICPTFKEKFSDKIVNIDDTAKFECIIVGKPTPKIRWYYNDKPVQGKHFLTSTSGDRQVLTIPAVTHETVGKIACSAENEIGKATCVAYLNLIGDLAPPSSEQCQRYIEEYNTESSNITIRKQLVTTTHTSQISSFQSENGVPIVDTANINASQPEKVKDIGQHFGTTELSEFQKNTTANSALSRSTDNVHKSTRKGAAPRFISPLIGKILDQGSDTILEAIVDGHPVPEIVLTRNGEPLVDKDNVNITRQFSKIIIELRNVTIADAGRYSCSATNNMGNAISTADIVVKKSIFPPVFGHRLQAQVAKRGEHILMDVEVSGIPDPVVTWFKNNKPLEETSGAVHKIRKSGNSYTLIIEKANTEDAGKYMVRAVNAGGEAQSIADFVVVEPTPERMIEIVKTITVENVDEPKEQIHKPAASNISVNTRHIKIKEEPIVQRIPSPVKFKKTELRESEYESDYEIKIQPIWRPTHDSDTEIPHYKPIKPVLTPTGRFSTVSSDRSPIPPSEFERPPKFDGAMRPKFEPIDKYKTTTTTEHLHKTTRDYEVLKPTPVSAKPYSQPNPMYNNRTLYYTATAGPPYHNQNRVATETCNQMEMREQTESCRRVVNMSSTQRVFQFDHHQQHEQHQEQYQHQNQQQQQYHQNTFEEQLEPLPFKASIASYTSRQKLAPPPTPTKFIPAEFRESDYDSEIEAMKIRPIWTPSQLEADNLHYRRVLAPTPSRSVSVPRNYCNNQRILTPMEFDTVPVEMPSKIYRTPSSSPQYCNTRDNFKTQTLDRFRLKKKSDSSYGSAQDDINVARSTPNYSSSVKTAAQQFTRNEENFNSSYKQYEFHGRKSASNDLKIEAPKPILKRTQSATESLPIYREESKVSQYENNMNGQLETGIIVNCSNDQQHLPKRAPIFITPLKDIAVVSGQTARFECIVQCDPHPVVEWYRNDMPLRNGDGKHFVEFRNGVCRLTIPEALTSDAGIYSCTGTNHLGSVVTSAELIVPSENWGTRK